MEKFVKFIIKYPARLRFKRDITGLLTKISRKATLLAKKMTKHAIPSFLPIPKIAALWNRRHGIFRYDDRHANP